jgi:DNA polymerase III sliding clamp (beta) subunit (PCNA family)
MEFTANRLELLEITKKVAKIADDASPIEALRGILIESDSDTGEILMTATNYEASILMKTKATIMRSGKMVVNAKLLIGMLSLLSGEGITFYDAGNSIIKVSSGACLYCVRCLPGGQYPKPMLPFPEETVKLSSICSLAKKTVFAVAKVENNAAMPVLQCVCLKINQNNAHAAACDGLRMMLVKGSAESSGATEFLLPAKSFQIFASIADDAETYDVGIVGNETVFVRDNMLF